MAEQSFDTAGLSDMESSVSSPRILPRSKIRVEKSVSKVQLPPLPVTSRSPRVKSPRSRETQDNVNPASKTVNLSSDNGNTTGSTQVIHPRRIKRKRVIESDEESEPTAKKSISVTAAIEHTSPPSNGSTYKTRRKAAKANLRPKDPPDLIGANDRDALKVVEQVEPTATGKRGPEVQSAKATIVDEAVGRPETHSSSKESHNQTKVPECERILEWVRSVCLDAFQ